MFRDKVVRHRVDIYSARKQVDKVLQYINNISEEDVQRMYKPSRDRLQDLAVCCNTISDTISELLQNNIRVEDNASDMALVNKGIGLELQSIDDKGYDLAVASRVDGSSKSKVTPSKLDVSRSEQSKSKISVGNRRTIMKSYRDTLEALAKQQVDNIYVRRCAYMLWQWFETRFYKSKSIGSEFRYNIRRIGTWIQDFVVVFAYHVVHNDLVEFESSFQSWCELIQSQSCKYAIPYEVYRVDSQPDPEDYTLCAVVLWDLLVELGLKSVLSVCDQSEVYLSPDSMYEKCLQMNPSQLDYYADYRFNPEVLSSGQLLVEGGDNPA